MGVNGTKTYNGEDASWDNIYIGGSYYSTGNATVQYNSTWLRDFIGPGGLIVVYSETLLGSGKFSAASLCNRRGWGTPGGGSVNIFCLNLDSNNSFSLDASALDTGSISNNLVLGDSPTGTWINGGSGSISIGDISTGRYSPLNNY